MIRKKGPVCLVTFHTTADAMALEACCREASIPGRLLPVPRRITSDCGIAWASPLEQREALTGLMEQKGLDHAGIYEMEG